MDANGCCQSVFRPVKVLVIEGWGIDQNTHKGLLLINTESFDIYFTEYGTALTTVLPILFLYLNTVTVTAGTFEP